jgi:hypothetical protein
MATGLEGRLRHVVRRGESSSGAHLVGDQFEVIAETFGGFTLY